MLTDGVVLPRTKPLIKFFGLTALAGAALIAPLETLFAAEVIVAPIVGMPRRKKRRLRAVLLAGTLTCLAMNHWAPKSALWNSHLFHHHPQAVEQAHR
jgi:hypothetical protein